LTRQLGTPNIGEVWEAQDLSGERPVAVKFFNDALFTGLYETVRPAWEQRFEREIVITKEIDHPCKPGFLAEGRVRGRRYYVMDLIDGPDLKTLREECHPLDGHSVAAIIAQVCCVLEVVHRRDFVHRDIKPENIMVRSDGFVQLIDFGASLDRRPGAVRRTYRGQIFGSEGYVAPEYCESPDRATVGTDIYSLGCVLFELIFGFVPERRTSALRTFPAGTAKRVLADLAEEMVAYEPEDRPRSSRVVHDRLAALLPDAGPDPREALFLPLPDPVRPYLQGVQPMMPAAG
jgi:serine/threonine-protein kinase